MTIDYRLPAGKNIEPDIACRADRQEPVPGIRLRCIAGREVAIERAARDGAWRGSFWRCPGRGDPNSGEISALCTVGGFSYPRKPRQHNHRGPWKFHFHEGIDLEPGTVEDRRGRDPREIRAVVAGVVKVANLTQMNGFRGYGRVVYIEGNDGKHYLYAHCSRLFVAAGDRVEEGRVIAYIGRTLFDEGSSAEHLRAEEAHADGGPVTWDQPMGAHLHFEVSRTPYAKRPEEERTPEGEGREHREDPIEVLKELGPWGRTYLDPVYYPDGTIVSSDSEQRVHARIEAGSGGYFPIGLHGSWHGGVHFPIRSGGQIIAPLSGEIVALRLDEQAGGLAFGSPNFILIRHTLTKPVLVGLRAERTQGPSESARIELGPPPSANDHDFVRTVKLMLSQLHVRTNAATASPTPFYEGPEGIDPQSDLEDGTPNVELVNAIIKYREHQRVPARQLRTPLTPASRTWTHLLRRYQQHLAAMRAARGESAADAVLQGLRDARSSNPRVAADALPTVYSLFMHLGARPLDALMATCPWLRYATIPPTPEAIVAQRDALHRESVAERAEAGNEDWGRGEQVGIPWAERSTASGAPRRGPQPRAENRPRLVAWVKRRLHRFGYWPSTDVNETYTPELGAAIGTFRGDYAPRDRQPGRNGQGASAPQWLTHDNVAQLRHPPPATASFQSFGTATSPPVMNQQFQAAVRARDEHGHAKVVSNLSIPISDGMTLFVAPTTRAAEGQVHVHWEMFSAQKLSEGLTSFEDPNDDFFINGSAVGLLERVRHILFQDTAMGDLEREALAQEVVTQEQVDTFERNMTTRLVEGFYRHDSAHRAREYQVRFKSEWSFEPDRILQFYRDMGVDTNGQTAQSVAPYSWWDAAKDVLPTSPLVWHYNPVHLMHEIAELQHRFIGCIDVVIENASPRRGPFVVAVSAADHRLYDKRSVANPSQGVELGPLQVGTYVVSLEEAGSTIASVIATVDVGLHGHALLVVGRFHDPSYARFPNLLRR